MGDDFYEPPEPFEDIDHNPCVWIDQNGVAHHIEEMGTGHIKNCMKMLDGYGLKTCTTYYLMGLELRIRNLEKQND